jgi:hypothetical protein
VSLLTSAHRSLYPLVGAGVVRVRLGVFVLVWVGIIVCGWASSFFGWLWWSGGCRWSLALGVVSCVSLAASMGWGCGGCQEVM